MNKLITIGALTVAAYYGAFVNAQVYPDGMIAQWKFDETSGSVAYDSVGGNDGTVTGATWTPGFYDGALSFDGVDDLVELPASVSELTTQDITIEAWIKPTGDKFEPRAQFSILRRASHGPDPAGWGASLTRMSSDAVNRDKIWFVVVIHDGVSFRQYIVSSRQRVTLDQWHHVVGIRRGTTIEVWLDGVVVSRPGVLPNNNPLRGNTISHIGGIWPGLPFSHVSYFEGLMDEVAVYDRGLSHDEIQVKYAFDNWFGDFGEEELDLLGEALTSLTSKVENALDSLNAGNENSAVGIFQAFINQVEALRGIKLTEDRADELIQITQDRISLIGSS